MSNMKRTNGTSPLAKAAALGVALLAFASGQQAVATPAGRAQARRMYERLTGTPPSESDLTRLEAMVGSGSIAELEATAADIIDPDHETSKNFYTVTLKNFASPWTNRDQSVFAPLNDYTATVIGLIKDDNADFRQVLFENVLYVGSSGPAYSPTSNAHYEALESNSVDLRTLRREVQSALNGLPPEATAGVITSRAGAEAFFIDGTNRAMFRFTLLNHMCRDLEQVHDTSLPPDRIRQDVTRSPGGDSSVFNNNCVGCHNVMDSMAQAFAYYDFDETVGRLVYTPNQVQPKYLINADNFKPGYVTPNDAWENRMRLPGRNDAGVLGWSSNLPGRGNGAKSMGEELAYSGAFAQCQAEKAYRKICFRSPSTQAEYDAVKSIGSNFQTNGSMRTVFAQVAAQCAGQ
ncbi:hypothetical protein GCM10011487_34990 [Steroidobacter agaridevorans]|uniref:DUF1585 domain-containing protein n=2 Tax=Steroidobacter agaridevorans TaxID=2695856 RepID=A0A829YE09_9GAMM|nr:hypothetical protein [Steroidobacter agaridevorans]GFE81499.1 hypothetical protein GCM10011487_34990 [Steroidobacter agaridevorans]